MKKIVRIMVGLFALCLIVSGCQSNSSNNKSTSSGDTQNVKIAVVGSGMVDVWKYVAEKAKAENINLEVVAMNDYVQPNVALNDGSVDMNAFQHGAFLKQWNEEHNGNLVSIGTTFITPLYIFSDKVSDLKDLPDKAKVIIPIEPAIQGRALLAFETAGVIKLKPGVETKATLNDIVENPKNIQFTEAESASAPRMLQDVDAAVINGTFATDAGLNISDAIFTDGDHLDTIPTDRYNIIAVRGEDKDNATYKKIVSLFQSDDVAAKMEEIGKGQYVPVWNK